MKLCFGRHRARGLRRERRGAATSIGSIFFFVIAITLIGFFYEIAQNQIQMQGQDAQKASEDLNTELLILADGHIQITVINRGYIPIRLLRIWVIDKTANNHISYPNDITQKMDLYIPPWDEVIIRSDESEHIDNWVLLDNTHEYSIRLVTERGNIIEPTPILAIEGEGVTSSEWPDWVSLSETEFSEDPDDTPVPRISINNDGDAYTQGQQPWLSIKNTGDKTFFVTYQTRLIFKDTTDGTVYASAPNEWETYTGEEGDWDKEDNGNLDSSKDSAAVYPYPQEPYVLVLRFDKPQDVPGQGSTVPSGTYHVYLHISGYDDVGNTYFEAIYYGELTF